MLEIRWDDDGKIVLAGRFDAAQVPKADEFLGAVTESRTVDLSGLSYISSAGLGVLLKVQQRLAGRGGGLKLINPNHHILDIFRYSGFDQIFEIEVEPGT